MRIVGIVMLTMWLMSAVNGSRVNVLGGLVIMGKNVVVRSLWVFRNGV